VRAVGGGGNDALADNVGLEQAAVVRFWWAHPQMQKLVVVALAVVICWGVYALVGLWYDRMIARVDAVSDAEEAKKRALLDTLKSRSRYYETMQLLRRYEEKPAGMSTRTPVALSRAAPPRALPSPGQGMESPVIQNMTPSVNGHVRRSGEDLREKAKRPREEAGYDDEDAMAQVAPGTVLLNRFVDLLAGDARDDIDGSSLSSSSMAELRAELASERQARQQIEEQLHRLQAELKKHDPMFVAGNPTDFVESHSMHAENSDVLDHAPLEPVSKEFSSPESRSESIMGSDRLAEHESLAAAENKR